MKKEDECISLEEEEQQYEELAKNVGMIVAILAPLLLIGIIVVLHYTGIRPLYNLPVMTNCNCINPTCF